MIKFNFSRLLTCLLFVLFNYGASAEVVYPDVNGTWYNNGLKCTISGTNPDLIVVNEYGNRSNATNIGVAIIATNWNMLMGAFESNNTKINWNNGSSWTRYPTIGGTWFFGSKVTSIEQKGTLLTFTNERGNSSSGYFQDPSQIIASGWGNLAGVLNSNNDKISWGNNSQWIRLYNISGMWTTNGKQARITQSGTSLVFTNEFGNQAVGNFLNANQVIANDWGGLKGSLDSTRKIINWANGTVWTMN